MHKRQGRKTPRTKNKIIIKRLRGHYQGIHARWRTLVNENYELRSFVQCYASMGCDAYWQAFRSDMLDESLAEKFPDLWQAIVEMRADYEEAKDAEK